MDQIFLHCCYPIRLSLIPIIDVVILCIDYLQLFHSLLLIHQLVLFVYDYFISFIDGYIITYY